MDWLAERRARYPDAPRVPLCRVRADRRQEAHGQVRHPRRRGGRPAARGRLRGPLQGGEAGLRHRHAELLAEGGRAPLSRRRTGAVFSAGGSIVEYQRWIDSGEPRQWPSSPVLRGSASTIAWIANRSSASGAGCWTGSARAVSNTPPMRCGRRRPRVARARAAGALADRLVQRGPSREEQRRPDGKLDQLIGWLVEFHRREEKPMWWRMFDRHEMTVEERFDDRDCLARPQTDRSARVEDHPAVARLRVPVRPDPGDQARGRRPTATSPAPRRAGRDRRARRGRGPGRAQVHRHAPGPAVLSSPTSTATPIRSRSHRPVRSGVGARRGRLPQAVDDLLRRRPPRVAGHAGGPLVPGGADLVSGPARSPRLDGTTLCIQGPPGAGRPSPPRR